MIKILLVDDHELVRVGLQSLLAQQHDFQLMTAANSGEEAIRAVNREQPDVILMDVKMPGIGGLEATRHIKNVFPNIKIIALTSYFSEPYPARFIAAGATGYLTKDSEVPEMFEAIAKVHKGQPYLSKSLSTRSHDRTVDRQADTWKTLSEREMQVLLMLTNGLKPDDIASKLAITSKTVNSYRYRIFEKLDVQNDVELTRFAINYGLVDPNDT